MDRSTVDQCHPSFRVRTSRPRSPAFCKWRLKQCEAGKLAIRTSRWPSDTEGPAFIQGYTLPLVIREAKFLQRAIGECIQQNLLAIEVSYWVADMIQAWETIYTELETSIRSFSEERDRAAKSRTGAKQRLG